MQTRNLGQLRVPRASGMSSHDGDLLFFPGTFLLSMCMEHRAGWHGGQVEALRQQDVPELARSLGRLRKRVAALADAPPPAPAAPRYAGSQPAAPTAGALAAAAEAADAAAANAEALLEVRLGLWSRVCISLLHGVIGDHGSHSPVEIFSNVLTLVFSCSTWDEMLGLDFAPCLHAYLRAGCRLLVDRLGLMGLQHDAYCQILMLTPVSNPRCGASSRS